MSILHESQSFPNGFCQRSGGVEVFDCYVQCNLAAPDGIRGAMKNGDSADSDSDEVKDKSKLVYQKKIDHPDSARLLKVNPD